MKELIVASNMIATARGRNRTKPNNSAKRSAMLRMIMPFLSRETGDALANAIHDRNSKKFAAIWDKVKHEVRQKLEHPNKATAAASIKIEIPDDMLVQVIKMVCERMCLDKDPCPLPPVDCCVPDVNANILELYNKLVASDQ